MGNTNALEFGLGMLQVHMHAATATRGPSPLSLMSGWDKGRLGWMDSKQVGPRSLKPTVWLVPSDPSSRGTLEILSMPLGDLNAGTSPYSLLSGGRQHR